MASLLSKDIICLGDFNVNYLKSKNNKEFKDIFTLYGFTQLIKNATRITELSSTLIDLITPNNPSSIAATIVYATSLSDHDMVGCIARSIT